MKKFYLFILIIQIGSCQSCFKEYDDTGSLIAKKLDFIAGVIAPDSSAQFTRNYETEVFVGRMIPAERKNIYFIKGVKNPLLYHLLYGTRQWYRVYYDFDSTAKVYIKSNNDSILLTYSGYGIYKDIHRSLKIRTGEDYHLIVKKNNGLVYRASTQVPKEICLLEPIHDTLKIVPDSSGWKLINLIISYVEKPAYFILYSKKSNFPPWHFYSMKGHDLIQEIGFVKSGVDTTRITFIDIYWELCGMDLNFARFNSPINNTGSDDFWSYLDSLERLPIHQRSNIEGGNDVVGVFGSYNAAVKRFTAMALWDSTKLKHRK